MRLHKMIGFSFKEVGQGKVKAGKSGPSFLLQIKIKSEAQNLCKLKIYFPCNVEKTWKSSMLSLEILEIYPQTGNMKKNSC